MDIGRVQRRFTAEPLENPVPAAPEAPVDTVDTVDTADHTDHAEQLERVEPGTVTAAVRP